MDLDEDDFSLLQEEQSPMLAANDQFPAETAEDREYEEEVANRNEAVDEQEEMSGLSANLANGPTEPPPETAYHKTLFSWQKEDLMRASDDEVANTRVTVYHDSDDTPQSSHVQHTFKNLQ